jgi:osmoprotectant transport system ATP-binding protein
MIRLEGIAKSYDGGQSLAVRECSLAIPAQAFVALIGDSGSGKTTLLKMMNRLIEPDRGSIEVDGHSVAEAPGYLLRRRIGYVFQRIGLFPHFTVAENIAVTPRLLGWSEPQITARTSELIEMVALSWRLLTRMPSELSGGQAQRVGVARALAARPAIMLMDEPFAALDPVTRDALGTEYRQLHEKIGLTTVMVTHDVLEAVLLADRIIVMRAGAIVADGEPHELLAGHGDSAVRTLMNMPRRQAERVRALLEERTSHG